MRIVKARGLLPILEVAARPIIRKRRIFLIFIFESPGNRV